MTLHPHILMNNHYRRIQTLASDWGIILQPSGKYVDGSIKCLPAEIMRIYGRIADVRFHLFLCLGPQAVPSPLWSLQMTSVSLSLSRSGSVRLAVTVRDEQRRLKWIHTNRSSSVHHQTRGKQLFMKHNSSMLKPSAGICRTHHI